MRNALFCVLFFALLFSSQEAWSAGAASRKKGGGSPQAQQQRMQQQAQAKAQQQRMRQRQGLKGEVAQGVAIRKIKRDLILAEIVKQKKILKHMAQRKGQQALQIEMARQQRIAQHMTEEIGQEALRQLLGMQNKILQDMARELGQETFQEELARQDKVLGELDSIEETAIEEEEEKIAEIVSISQIWDAFEKSSEAWSLIMDVEAKEITVAKYINSYLQQKIIIRKPPQLYVTAIDSMSKGSPEMLKQPFAQLLQFIAIMEYDFDNGMDKDKMARQMLGEQGFEQNKKRLGID